LKSKNDKMNCKIAIITGGAHGIGKAIAKSLSASNYIVIIADIDNDKGIKVVDEVNSAGGNALFIKTDLCSENDILNLVNITIETFGGLDIVINSARPLLKIVPFIESFDEWDYAINVLLKAPALLAKYSYNHLKKSSNGCIINIGSTNENYISHQPVSYHVAKAGLVHLTHYLAREFGVNNIRVNTISPGLVDIHEDGRPLTGKPMNKEIVDITVPLKRAASPQEIAYLVLFLCSKEASYITGQTITIDGGITLNDHFHIARQVFTAKNQ
jgi:NAD(P)-dependent dehydrogenase (short-subunit alcohol dehydrogenase family)